MKKIFAPLLVIACFIGLLSVPSDSQIPGTTVPIWGNATKLIDTTNEEFGVAHTAGVLQTIVNSSALPSGASTEAKQDDAITQLALAVSGLTDLLTELQLKADLTETQPVSNASLPLPSGASTSAKQLAENHTVDIQGKISDSTYTTPRIDSATYAIETIEYPHHEIHDGNSYEYTNALDFTNAETKSFILAVADTTAWVHFTFDISGELEYNVDFYEDASPDADGAAVSAPAVINKDRNSGNTPGLVLTGGPTLGAGAKGTLIRRHHAGSGKKAGGTSRGEAELILDQGKKYWVDITNVSTSNNFIAWSVAWYEHVNK